MSKYEDILISVCVTTYNHRPYIEDCLEGILKQEGDFQMEVLLGEDESTDGTRDICREYAEQYDQIWLFLGKEEEKLYVNGSKTGRINAMRLLSKSRGKYIAWCDGDDVWTDPMKLDKQLQVMEQAPRVTICCHDMKKVTEHTKKDIEAWSGNSASNILAPRKRRTFDDLIKGNFIYMSSVMYRADEIPDSYPDVFFKTNALDFPLHYYVALKGDIYYIPEVMGYYNQHEEGRYAGLNVEKKLKFSVELRQVMIDANVPRKEKLKESIHHFYLSKWIAQVISSNNIQLANELKQKIDWAKLPKSIVYKIIRFVASTGLEHNKLFLYLRKLKNRFG